MQNNIQFKAKYVSSNDKIADAISRKQWKSLRRVAPHADKDPRPIPVIAIADEDEEDCLLAASVSVNTHNTYRLGLQAFEALEKSKA